MDSPPSGVGELLKGVKLFSRWHEIGTRLGLDEDELDAIRYSSDRESDKAGRMYRLWLDSGHATRRQIVEVLEDMDLNRQAEHYKKYVGKIFSWHSQLAIAN